jgi:hypothetical protein
MTNEVNLKVFLQCLPTYIWVPGAGQEAYNELKSETAWLSKTTDLWHNYACLWPFRGRFSRPFICNFPPFFGRIVDVDVASDPLENFDFRVTTYSLLHCSSNNYVLLIFFSLLPPICVLHLVSKLNCICASY